MLCRYQGYAGDAVDVRKHKLILDECIGLLSVNGIDVSDALKKVIIYFFSNDNHISLDDVSAFVRSNNLSISDDVVSSAFKLLVEYGFAKEKVFGDNTLRYEHLHIGEHHDHFYCLKCKRIIEFYSPVIEVAQIEEARRKGFHAFSHAMQIHGLCDRCFGKASQSPIRLSMVQSGGKFRVVGPAERNRGRQKLKRRLCDMGLRPGAEGEVIVNRYGPLVVCIDGMRIAMGREMGTV